MRMALSVCCTVTGRSLVGRLPMVRSTGLPAPLRMTMTRSARPGSCTSWKRAHFIRAFSTSSWAVLLASGSLREVPASGSMMTQTVWALRTKLGTWGFFLATAREREETTRRKIREATRWRMVIRASIGIGEGGVRGVYAELSGVGGKKRKEEERGRKKKKEEDNAETQSARSNAES